MTTDSSASAAASNLAVQFSGDIIISASDKRTYRHITLANQLKCLLICDPTAEKSAACCDVHVGSLCDPPEAQGLAHFLEHMLFMGTEKYPTENQYSAFLNAHGGGSNAYTSTENTVYFFDVLSEYFEDALDLFSTFFTCPLFTESGVMREIQAVDSENSKNLQSDAWRKYQLMKSMARPDHALHSFSTGNLHTLHEVPTAQGTNIRDLMLSFYRKHYSANLMQLVVYGAASLDTLQQWVTDKFSAIPNQDLSRAVFPSDPFRPEQLQRWVSFVPVRDLKVLELVFPLPSVDDHYKSKPCRYFGHLLGHESDGSVLSALKARRWADALSCYVETSARDFAMYTIRVELTTEGLGHVDDIVCALFAYIGMIRRAGPQDWVWQELRDTADMAFRFLDQCDAQSYVVRLANGMHLCAPQHAVCSDALLLDKDLPLALRYLDRLCPQNLLVFLAHKGLAGQTDREETWYRTPYATRPVTDEEKDRWTRCLAGGSDWDAALHFPQPNPFLPSDFALRLDGGDGDGDGDEGLPRLLAHEREAGPGPLAATSEETATPEETAEAEAEAEEEAEEEAEAAVPVPTAWQPVLPGTAGLLWHKDDRQHRWDLPKTIVHVFLHSPAYATLSAWHVALTDMLAQCLTEALAEYAYYADCAGLGLSVDTTRSGLAVGVEGYTHKLSVLLHRALDVLHTLCTQSPPTSSGEGVVDDGLFQRVKEKVLRGYKNQLFMQPYYHCVYANYACLEQPRWTAFEKHAALADVPRDSFQAFAREWIRFLKVEVLVTGNSTRQDAVDIDRMVHETLRCRALPASMEATCRCVDLFRTDPFPCKTESSTSTSTGEAGKVTEYVHMLSAHSYNPAEVNSAVEALYLVGAGAGRTAPLDGDALGLEAVTNLVAHILSEPAFDVLRTKEQLGYIAYASKKRVAMNILAISVVVQSSHKDALYLDTRIEAFLQAYREDLKAMDEATFQDMVQAVVEKLLEKPKNLSMETNIYKDELTNKTYLFDRRQRLVEKLRDTALVNRTSVLDFYDRFLLPGSAHRRKFGTQYYGKMHKLPQEMPTLPDRRVVIVKTPSEFKQKMAFLPVQSFEV